MFDPARLTVTFAAGTTADGPLEPRRYTLTHSDRSGRLFLTIGPDYDRRALRAPQVRLMRDEVLGEWRRDRPGTRLELHMAAQGGLPLFGTARMRVRVFRSYKDLVLGALAHGDARLLAASPELATAPVVAVFHWRGGREEREEWGRLEQRTGWTGSAPAPNDAGRPTARRRRPSEKEHTMPRVALDTPAPDFTLPDPTGQPVSPSDFRGSKNVLLVFNRGFT